MVQDARQRTKVYLDLYMDHDNLTKDNDSTRAPWVVMYSDMNYPLIREFKDKNRDIVFAIGEPTTEPIMGHDQVHTHYRESVPIHIITVDKTGVTAAKLNWKGEAELRRITETYPTGSQRSLSRSAGSPYKVGDHTLHRTTFTLRYVRDLT